MRPTRLVVGEVRQAEALDLLIAMNSGMPSMATLHANSAREAVTKLCTLPLLAGQNIAADFVVPTVAASIDIVVHGSIGHMSAFMAQSGNLVVLGDAGEALGDSLYEARLFVRGSVKSLGADCIEKEMRPEHIALLADLLKRGEADGKAKPEEFKRYGSARKLYNFNIDNASAY